MWIVALIASISADLLLVQSFKVLFKWGLLHGALAGPLYQALAHLRRRARLILIRSGGAMRDADSFVQLLNPACRAARKLPHLPAARLIFSISDGDIPQTARPMGWRPALLQALLWLLSLGSSTAFNVTVELLAIAVALALPLLFYELFEASVAALVTVLVLPPILLLLPVLAQIYLDFRRGLREKRLKEFYESTSNRFLDLRTTDDEDGDGAAELRRTGAFRMSDFWALLTRKKRFQIHPGFEVQADGSVEIREDQSHESSEGDNYQLNLELAGRRQPRPPNTQRSDQSLGSSRVLPLNEGEAMALHRVHDLPAMPRQRPYPDLDARSSAVMPANVALTQGSAELAHSEIEVDYEPNSSNEMFGEQKEEAKAEAEASFEDADLADLASAEAISLDMDLDMDMQKGPLMAKPRKSPLRLSLSQRQKKADFARPQPIVEESTPRRRGANRKRPPDGLAPVPLSAAVPNSGRKAILPPLQLQRPIAMNDRPAGRTEGPLANPNLTSFQNVPSGGAVQPPSSGMVSYRQRRRMERERRDSTRSQLSAFPAAVGPGARPAEGSSRDSQSHMQLANLLVVDSGAPLPHFDFLAGMDRQNPLLQQQQQQQQNQGIQNPGPQQQQQNQTQPQTQPLTARSRGGSVFGPGPGERDDNMM